MVIYIGESLVVNDVESLNILIYKDLINFFSSFEANGEQGEFTRDIGNKIIDASCKNNSGNRTLRLVLETCDSIKLKDLLNGLISSVHISTFCENKVNIDSIVFSDVFTDEEKKLLNSLFKRYNSIKSRLSCLIKNFLNNEK